MEIWDIVESVTYVLPIRSIVGAPGLDFETWKSTNSMKLPYPLRDLEYFGIGVDRKHTLKWLFPLRGPRHLHSS
jgi:hypothetical protein